MDQSLATWAAVVLAAKIFADLLREGYGFYTRNVIASAHNLIEIDLAYGIAFMASLLVVMHVGAPAGLLIAILMRAGYVVNNHILLTGNHPILELFVAVVLLRLLDRPIALASTVQLMTASVWIYSAMQKLYHGEFRDGSYFCLAFQNAGLHGRYARFQSKVARIEGDFAPVDPASQALCRRLALMVLVTEIASPILALAMSGTIWSVLLLLVVTVPVGFVSRETNFMLTNTLLASFFLVPFDGAALLGIANDWLASAVVIWFLVWPPLHAVLTKRFRVSTWQLAGWGMYATMFPRIHVIAPDGALAEAPRNPAMAYGVLRVCGASEIRWLRMYANRAFFHWCHPAPASGLVFSWYRRRGDRYVTRSVVLWNTAGARPMTFEIHDEHSAAEFRRYLASVAAAPARFAERPAALSTQPA